MHREKMSLGEMDKKFLWRNRYKTKTTSYFEKCSPREFTVTAVALAQHKHCVSHLISFKGVAQSRHITVSAFVRA